MYSIYNQRSTPLGCCWQLLVVDALSTLSDAFTTPRQRAVPSPSYTWDKLISKVYVPLECPLCTSTTSTVSPLSFSANMVEPLPMCPSHPPIIQSTSTCFRPVTYRPDTAPISVILPLGIFPHYTDARCRYIVCALPYHYLRQPPCSHRL